MAASQGTIDRLRVRIRDVQSDGAGTAVPDEPARVAQDVTYKDNVYEQTVVFALEKLSYDFSPDVDYTEDTQVPYSRKFLLVKLATIELCYIRAGDVEVSAGGDITSITVPDLSVAEGSSSAGGYWLELASTLQSEYDGEVGSIAEGTAPGSSDAMPEVEVGTMFRRSLRTGRRTPYDLDTALAAPSSFAGSWDVPSSRVILTWGTVLDEYFAYYEVYRSADLADLTPYPNASTRIEVIPDAHGKWYEGIVEPHTFDTPGSGTWYYLMATVNSNTLRGLTSVVTVVVP